MKVLWFTNTPSFANYLLKDNIVGGGWIVSLEKEIHKEKDVELGIAFLDKTEKEYPKTYKNVVYFPIRSKKSFFKNIFYKLCHNIENDDYLNKSLSIIDIFKPDIINIFGTELFYGRIINLTDVPVVIHIQSVLNPYLFNWFPINYNQIKVFTKTNIFNLLKGSGLFHDYYRFKKQASREIEFYANCNYFLGRTDWDNKMTHLLSPKAKYFHIDEILREDFYHEQWEIKKQREYIVVSSTINPNIYKGLEIIFETARILEKFTSIKVKWNIFGVNKRDEIFHLFKNKLDVSLNRVELVFMGKLSPNELKKELLNSDIFVHPSHIDNSPNSICEAMLLGLPVISSFVGGIPSIIEHSIDGVLINSYDPFQLASEIMHLANDKDKQKAFSQNARKRAYERHNPQKIAKELLDVYNSILNETK